MPGKHTARQKRQAKHVADSERRRGMDPKRAESIGWATVNAQKGFQIISLDDCYADLMKDGGKREAYNADAMQRRATDPGRTAAVSRPPPSVSDVGSRPPKKFPRRLKPTVQMKPISDAEAMTHIRSGNYDHKQQKSLRWLAALKALATGYSKVSGGGALKAANRGTPLGPDGRPGDDDARFRRRARLGQADFGPDGRLGPDDARFRGRSRRQRRSGGALDLSLSLEDLSRAMSAMPPPSGPAKPPSIYLPGVHNPKSPVRRVPGLKKMTSAGARPSTTSDKSPKVVDGGGATVLSNSVDNVVLKSEGDPMAIDFNDLFKSELGDDHLVDCPHCEAPISKSDLAKAHKGKGKVTHQSGPKHGKSSAHVKDQNPEGGTMRGGDGRGVHTPSRGVPGAKKHDEVRVQSAGKHKGKLPGVSKAGPDCSGPGDDSSSGESDSGDGDGVSKAGQPAEQAPVKKSTTLVTIRGTEHVQYIDDGSDARIAKAIAEGALGGTPPTQPLDRNHDLSHLLI